MTDTISVSWATIVDVRSSCPPCAEALDADELDPAVLDDCLLVSSAMLFNLTGRQWPGSVRDVVRPNGGFGALSYPPASVALSSIGCGCSVGRPGCSWVPEIELPGYPVTDVNQVLIDGDVVDPALYRVDDQRWLVWVTEQPVQAGESRRVGWPCCQRQRLASTERYTFEVDYQYGAEPPLGGVRSAALLGCQLALASSTSEAQRKKCRLSPKTTSVVRQGVTMQLLTEPAFATGVFGLAEVDMWVASELLGKQRRPAGFIDTQSYALRGNKVRRNNETVGS